MELKVLQGKDGWLFLDNDTNQCMDQITGNRPLSEAELTTWKNTLQQREAEFDRRRIAHFFFVPPNKECVYSEYLPEDVNISSERPIFQLTGLLSCAPDYLLPILANHKEDGILLYSKKDTHWNHYGAFLAYEYMASQIAKKVPIRRLTRNDVAFTVETVQGADLGAKIGQGVERKVVARIANSGAKLMQNNGISQTGNYRVYENPAHPNLPTCVMFCDSFSWDVREFFAESFSKLYVVRLPHVDWGMVDKMKPDVVITELVERFLVRPPVDGIGTLKRLVLKKRAAAAAAVA